MKNKLFSPARKEAGFTLIELLTVIVIIGILAAIAIPVFTSQRARAQDSQTVSDVRNIAVQAETFLVDKNNKFSDLSKANIEFASTKNVSWEIKGDNTLGGYCIVAKNTAGKKYATDATALTYDSLAGGLGRSNGACTTANTPTPSGSTAVGSDTVNTTPVGQVATLTSGSTNSSSTGTIQTYSITATGTYKIEAYGASGGNNTSSGGSGGLGAVMIGTVSLNSGDNLSVLVGQTGVNATTNGAGAGGGGGTFVVKGSSALVVAGGGAGGLTTNASALNASTTTIANASNNFSGGSNGGGGTTGNGNGWAGAGGGFTSNGMNGGTNGNGPVDGGGIGGKSFSNGGAGGAGSAGRDGGFGGGGGGGNGSAGAGGGYSGGSSGNSYATGGASYIVAGATNTSSSISNAGQGKVVITRIS